MSSLAIEWDVYQQNCPSRLVLDRIADKWAMLILGRLAEGTLRFNQLKRMVEGISQKVLTQTLRSLERDGLLVRKILPTSPIGVEYAITPLGATLTDAVEIVRRWTETHMCEVVAAQARFDREVGCGVS
jgi:DNA-binding HxlR family transcriptional regulator